MQTRAYTVVILMAQEKRFAIYTDPRIGKVLQACLTKTPGVRPNTHELMYRIFDSIEMRIIQVVINDVQDTIYYARMFLEHQMNGLRHIIEIDARPSDCLILALTNNQVPLFCTQAVLDKVILVEE